MATAGMALALLLAVPLALVVHAALSVSRIGPGPARAGWRALRARARRAGC